MLIFILVHVVECGVVISVDNTNHLAVSKNQQFPWDDALNHDNKWWLRPLPNKQRSTVITTPRAIKKTGWKQTRTAALYQDTYSKLLQPKISWRSCQIQQLQHQKNNNFECNDIHRSTDWHHLAPTDYNANMYSWWGCWIKQNLHSCWFKLGFEVAVGLLYPSQVLHVLHDHFLVGLLGTRAKTHIPGVLS